MKIPVKLILPAVALLSLSGNLQAAKTNPMDCPCYSAMVQLVAEATCKDIWDFTRTGRGKNGWTRNLLWIEGDSCTRLNVSAASSRVDAFRGEASGLASCDVTGDRCLMSELSPAEVKACNIVLRVSKRDVRKLPDCP